MDLLEQTKQNIRQALFDYGKHTAQHYVLEDASDTFVDRLARDSIEAKKDLRDLFSKSPAWHPELDALVINGNRTKNPDYNVVSNLGLRILNERILSAYDEHNHVLLDDLYNTIRFFSDQNATPEEKVVLIDSINRLSPDAYKKGKKRSRVFKSVCDSLGVTENTAGSEFQKLYAQFADELSTKKIDFKLIISINPAHFLTMSNPKEDSRGMCLTSCHSLNQVDYSYNNGCVGYARDNVSFIVFTVDDPDNPELYNNRKTTRQVFAYRPGSGLLLQSRMYNTSGGTRGSVAESKVYRDLVQREISALEDKPNLWSTGSSTGGRCDKVVTHALFGGYPDWKYTEFNGKISMRADCEDDMSPLRIGESGLCVVCGEDTTTGMYCEECNPWRICYSCDTPTRYMHEARDSNGNIQYVCSDCLERYCIKCEKCGEYHSKYSVIFANGHWYCPNCRDLLFVQCQNCGEWVPKDEEHCCASSELEIQDIDYDKIFMAIEME